MAEFLANALLAAGLFWWVFALAITLVMVIGYPLLAIMLVRHVKGIRSELARLNHTLSTQRPAHAAAAPGDDAADDLPLYVPGIHTRTGPLDIR